MRIHFIPVISLALLALLFTDGCKKKSSAPPAHKAVTASLTCSAASSAIAGQPPPHLALADLEVPSGSVSVNSQAISSSTGVSGISIDHSTIGAGGTHLAGVDLDTSATFMVWKACSQDGKQCSNKGKWTKDYTFDVSNIADMPTGIVNVTIAICVSDLMYLDEADRGSAVNKCDSFAPCYCGQELTTRYDNVNNPSVLDSAFKSANQYLIGARQEMLIIAQDYVNHAVRYVAQCGTKAKSGLGLQYAQNISTMAPATIALQAEQLASTMALLVQGQAASANSTMQLADASTPDCSSAPIASDSSSSSGSGGDTSSSGSGSGGDQVAGVTPPPDGSAPTPSPDGSAPSPTPTPTPTPTPAPSTGANGSTDSGTTVATGTGTETFGDINQLFSSLAGHSSSNTDTSTDTSAPEIATTPTDTNTYTGGGKNWALKGSLIGVGVALVGVSAYMIIRGFVINSKAKKANALLAEKPPTQPEGDPSAPKKPTMESLHRDVLLADDAMFKAEQGMNGAAARGNLKDYNDHLAKWNEAADRKSTLLTEQAKLHPEIKTDAWEGSKAESKRFLEDPAKGKNFKGKGGGSLSFPEIKERALASRNVLEDQKLAAEENLNKGNQAEAAAEREKLPAEGKKLEEGKGSTKGMVMMGVGAVIGILGGGLIAGGAAALADETGNCEDFMIQAKQFEGKLQEQESVIDKANTDLLNATFAAMGKK